MKRTITLLLIAMVVMFAVYAQGSGEAAADKPIVLKGGLVSAAETPQTRCLLDWAERVKEATNGRITIEVYPAEQLGNEKQLLENVNLGTIDFALIGPGGAERFTPVFGMFENAYTFQSVQHV
ncbi:MAG: TRAP transporter substrate-binding protein DctP, partial [Spirochaetales bacterium]|nr:TRAP transporter substrate-binding protein DctP [Spirochaetales bacterium]